MQNIPFLNVDPPPEAKLSQVSDVCASNVVWLPKLSHIRTLQDLLRQCYKADKDRSDEDGITHHAFPVVVSKKNLQLVGMITRQQIEYALYSAVHFGEHTMHFVHLLKYADRSPLTVYMNTRYGVRRAVRRAVALPVLTS